MNGQTGGYGATIDMVTGNIQKRSAINQPGGMRLAQTFTAEFGITFPTDTGGPGNVNCIATVQWVENGNQVKRLVSVGNGTTISGSGTGVQIDLQDIPLGPTYINGLKYQVSVLVAPGIRGSFDIPPAYQDAITFIVTPPSVLTTIDIPQDAGVKGVDFVAVDTAAPNTPPAIYVEALDPAGNVLKSWNPNLATPSIQRLPPNAITLHVVAITSVATYNYSWAWIVDG